MYIVAVKLFFPYIRIYPYIRRTTSPNDNFEYVYPLNDRHKSLSEFDYRHITLFSIHSPMGNGVFGTYFHDRNSSGAIENRKDHFEKRANINR